MADRPTDGVHGADRPPSDPPRHAAGSRLRSGPEVWILAALSLLVGLFLYFYVATQPSRSYAVSALARGVLVSFDASRQSEWRLRAASVCRPLPNRTRIEGPADPTAVCDPRRFEVAAPGPIEWVWPDGAEVALVRAGDGSVRIRVAQSSPGIVAADGVALPPGTLIVVKKEDFVDSGVLPFFGCATVGSQIRGGSGSELLAGRYEVRETIFPRRTPTVVDAGEFLPGDSLSFRHELAPEPSAPAGPGGDDGCFRVGGFIGSSAEEDGVALRVVAYAALGDPLLVVDRRGLDAKRIVPTWVDRAVKDPWLVGFGTLLTALTALASFVRGISSRFFATAGRPATAAGSEASEAPTPPGPAAPSP